MCTLYKAIAKKHLRKKLAPKRELNRILSSALDKVPELFKDISTNQSKRVKKGVQRESFKVCFGRQGSYISIQVFGIQQQR